MRVVLDTNILISALISSSGPPAYIYSAWESGRFTLLTCTEQIDELKAVLARPKIAALTAPYKVGRLVNELKGIAEMIPLRFRVKRSRDPNDDFLLSLCDAGEADFMVTGDKGDLLSLKRHDSSRILSASDFMAILRSHGH